MKKVKIAFWIVIFGFVGLLIYQNRIFFMAESHLVLNLGFFHYETPFLANAVFFVAFFLIGILMTYFLSLFKQFRDAKVIKALKAKESSLVETVATLERQLQQQKSAAAATPPPVSEPPVMDDTIDVAAETK
ncbi:hypothetical protein DESC_240044 [Desulfosarcina cetonica]|uniref:hypothetical protein n=1 Tax=Desulfosarcina cetonica TaxID=90730 RepID=UPI0006D28EAB|nr:hypothetical protein [Desulfosarcina cetonica]VTR64653.1 hypothetical protein DESC_240044 [Desulfosarcina cetonica]